MMFKLCVDIGGLRGCRGLISSTFAFLVSHSTNRRCSLVAGRKSVKIMSSNVATEDPAVTNFRNYIKVKTVQPQPDYDGAMQFLSTMAKEIDLPFKIIEVAPGRPVFLTTYEGTDPTLPSILLNSHTDVVPVFPDKWKYDPFAAVKDENGNIYGRGTQDMKCVGIQYLEAIRKMKKNGIKTLRTVNLSFVPDEEIGGELGMVLFLKTPDFAALNVGFALDEGLASPTDKFIVYHGERCPWWIKVTACGDPGHGLQLIGNTAAEKLVKVMNSFLEFRTAQKKKLEGNAELTIGDVTSVNMTIIKGGVQQNVIPTDMSAWFDVRVTPSTDLQEMERLIQKWISDAGSDVTYEYVQKWTSTAITCHPSADDPWWTAFSQVFQDLDLKLKTEIFPGATDSRYLRKLVWEPIINRFHLEANGSIYTVK